MAYFCSTAHWDEKFHHKMVDNRGFMVSRSHTISVSMMHRTGKTNSLFWNLLLKIFYTYKWTYHYLTLRFTGIYGFYEDTQNKLLMVSIPLAHKKSSMIFIMPYNVESLERLEKLLTRQQLDTWVSKLEERAVAISLPKVSMEVSHDLQVNSWILLYSTVFNHF